MKTYKLVVRQKGAIPTKTPISCEIAEVLMRWALELPNPPSGMSGVKELLVPKQQYDNIKPWLVEFLRNEKVAGDVAGVLSAMNSDHTAIILEQS